MLDNGQCQAVTNLKAVPLTAPPMCTNQKQHRAQNSEPDLKLMTNWCQAQHVRVFKSIVCFFFRLHV